MPIQTTFLMVFLTMMKSKETTLPEVVQRAVVLALTQPEDAAARATSVEFLTMNSKKTPLPEVVQRVVVLARTRSADAAARAVVLVLTQPVDAAARAVVLALTQPVDAAARATSVEFLTMNSKKIPFPEAVRREAAWERTATMIATRTTMDSSQKGQPLLSKLLPSRPSRHRPRPQLSLPQRHRWKHRSDPIFYHLPFFHLLFNLLKHPSKNLFAVMSQDSHLAATYQDTPRARKRRLELQPSRPSRHRRRPRLPPPSRPRPMHQLHLFQRPPRLRPMLLFPLL